MINHNIDAISNLLNSLENEITDTSEVLHDLGEEIINETYNAFLERAILSLNKYATAGSEKSYIFHTKTFDSDIYDVKVLNGGAGIFGKLFCHQ